MGIDRLRLPLEAGLSNLIRDPQDATGLIDVVALICHSARVPAFSKPDAPAVVSASSSEQAAAPLASRQLNA
jgi:hypothetical protein